MRKGTNGDMTGKQGKMQHCNVILMTDGQRGGDRQGRTDVDPVRSRLFHGPCLFPSPCCCRTMSRTRKLLVPKLFSGLMSPCPALGKIAQAKMEKWCNSCHLYKRRPTHPAGASHHFNLGNGESNSPHFTINKHILPPVLFCV